jgi:hypothetical protein
MEAQLKRSDITRYKRVDGVIGKLAIESKEVQDMMAPGKLHFFHLLRKLGVLEMAKSPLRSGHDQHNIGSVGCYIAHLNAW